jgi:hypothetical protein
MSFFSSFFTRPFRGYFSSETKGGDDVVEAGESPVASGKIRLTRTGDRVKSWGIFSPA